MLFETKLQTRFVTDSNPFQLLVRSRLIFQIVSRILSSNNWLILVISLFIVNLGGKISVLCCIAQDAISISRVLWLFIIILVLIGRGGFLTFSIFAYTYNINMSTKAIYFFVIVRTLIVRVSDRSWSFDEQTNTIKSSKLTSFWRTNTIPVNEQRNNKFHLV